MLRIVTGIEAERHMLNMEKDIEIRCKIAGISREEWNRRNMAHQEPFRCNLMKCAAGMGVAGNGVCFLGGNPQEEKCDRFKDETEFMEEWRKEDEALRAKQEASK